MYLLFQNIIGDRYLNKMKYIIVVVTFYTVFIINQQIQYNSDIILAVMTDDSHRRSGALTVECRLLCSLNK